MSRCKGSKADATRALILDAAARLFFKFGVNEVSIASIMAEIGMTNGGFYKYFSSKEMLAAEVCRLSFRKMQGIWEAQAVRAGLTAENPYRYLITQYLASAEQGRCAIVAFSHDAVGASPEQVFSQSYREGTRVLFETLLRVALASVPGRTKEQVLVDFSAMLGTALLRRTFGAEQWVQEIERALLDQCPPVGTPRLRDRASALKSSIRVAPSK
ncbi:hypothetical protein PS664_01687 [Pseudomonas fluorescens]|nr:hypothetical protein PS664_01687 [Pseudomonas fluorescens]